MTYQELIAEVRSLSDRLDIARTTLERIVDSNDCRTRDELAQWAQDGLDRIDAPVRLPLGAQSAALCK